MASTSGLIQMMTYQACATTRHPPSFDAKDTVGTGILVLWGRSLPLSHKTMAYPYVAML